MAQANPRLIHGRDRRLELIQAGIELLSEPERQPRVEDITRAAGTAKGTFYTYFESWSHFLVEIRNHLLEEYLVEMRQRIGGITRRSYWSTLRAEIEYFVDWISQRRELHRAVFHAPEVTIDIPDELSAHVAIAGVIDAGKRLGLVSTRIQGPIAARLIFRSLHCAGELLTSANRNQVLNETYRFVRAGLAA